MDWSKILLDIENKLIPHYQFDIWDRSMYFYLLVQTRVKGLEASTIPLSSICESLKISSDKARKTIRLLAEKGCIELEQTRKGHHVKVYLPQDLSIPSSISEELKIDIENLDFYKNREYVDQLVKRESSLCFYCLREISRETCQLDHVVPQQEFGDNSYKNIVASCHSCNTQKQGKSAEDYLRFLFRKNLLSEAELEGRMSAVKSLQTGDLKPEF